MSGSHEVEDLDRSQALAFLQRRGLHAKACHELVNHAGGRCIELVAAVESLHNGQSMEGRTCCVAQMVPLSDCSAVGVAISWHACQACRSSDPGEAFGEGNLHSLLACCWCCSKGCVLGVALDFVATMAHSRPSAASFS